MWQAGLIGHPITHSPSPAMHNAAFAHLGLAARYDLWPAPTSADLAQWVQHARQPDILGANVTIPHKIAVMPLLDDIAPSALAVGAVNTIVPRAGRLEGHNTDAAGLAAGLREDGHTHFQRGLVLGAGGAARAALEALRQLGATQIWLAARAGAAAQALLETASVPMTQLDLGGDIEDQRFEQAIRDADIVVNTTPIGSAEQPGMPLAPYWLARLKATAVVVDLIVIESELVRAARAHGLAVQTGAPMLLHQGALALTLWTGQAAPLEVMRAALTGVLSRD